jgi:hypothetical protein
VLVSGSTEQPQARTQEQLLAAAVEVLTEAARQTWTSTDPDGTSRTHRGDWAEFVTLALAGAAANVGGIEQVLAGRPGSWEADGVRNLLGSTVGHDEQHLLKHRTEPLVVDLYLDDVMDDLGVWGEYDAATAELRQRAVAAGQDEAQLDAIADLEERLEQQREQDWADYGAALKAAVEQAAAQVDGLRVLVTVNVRLEGSRPHTVEADEPFFVGVLRGTAQEGTPRPGAGRPPLERLQP